MHLVCLALNAFSGGVAQAWGIGQRIGMGGLGFGFDIQIQIQDSIYMCYIRARRTN